ncbi:MAG: PAS domain S-box protein, partial [Chloroflexota bacterium]
MKDKRKWLYVAVLVVIALVLVEETHILWPGFLYENEGLHSTVEAIGALTSIFMAVILLQKQPEEGGRRFYWVATGLLGGGILGIFHGVSQVGHGFVLFYSTSVLISGLGFALVWLPESERLLPVRKQILWGVIIGSVLFGIWTLLFRETLPLMQVGGQFTTTARIFNLLSGAFFITAAAYFFLDFHRSANSESYIFFCMSFLFGAASLMFTNSVVWNDAWWFWHGMCLLGYLLVMGFVVYAYQQTTLSLRTEIAQRKQSQEDLALRAQLLDMATDSILSYGLDGKFIYANEATYKSHGYSKDELMTMNRRDLVTPEYVPSFDTWVKRLIEQGEGVTESVHLRKDGTKMPVELHSRLIKADGRDVILGICRDITERKQVEALLSTISENSPIGVFITQDSQFRYVNPQFEKISGYTQEELLGQEASNLMYPDDRNQVRENAVRMLKGEQVPPYEYRGVKKNGEIRWITETVTSIQYRGERAILGNYMDVTELRQAEAKIKEMLSEDLRRRTIELEAVNKELEAFAYSVSHDLRAPLRSMDGFSRALLEDYAPKLDEEGKDYLNRVRS